MVTHDCEYNVENKWENIILTSHWFCYVFKAALQICSVILFIPRALRGFLKKLGTTITVLTGLVTV